jgi:hypothetical protein
MQAKGRHHWTIRFLLDEVVSTATQWANEQGDARLRMATVFVCLSLASFYETNASSKHRIIFVLDHEKPTVVAIHPCWKENRALVRSE